MSVLASYREEVTFSKQFSNGKTRVVKVEKIEKQFPVSSVSGHIDC